MSAATDNSQANTYATLPPEDTWVEYLRTRLPYSFKRVEEIPSRRRYRLDEPELIQDAPFSTPYHNYWKRGNAFYAAGKIADYHQLLSAGEAITKYMKEGEAVSKHVAEPLSSRLYGPALTRIHYSSDEVWNLLQIVKMWKPVQECTLERERAAMSSVSFAIELCLKEVMAHARYYEDGEFTFDATHDICQLYSSLPQSLQGEMLQESERFAHDYSAYRQQIKKRLHQIRDSHGVMLEPHRWGTLRQQWLQLIELMENSTYTAYGNNDPCPRPGADWLPKVLADLAQIEGMDRGTYFRYAPFHDTDRLPVKETIDSTLTLGRFLYEHLFPVLPDR